jgi:LPS-assembly protein
LNINNRCIAFIMKKALLLLLVTVATPPRFTLAMDLCSQCLLGVPPAVPLQHVADPHQLPLMITAQQGILQGKSEARFFGDVTVWQGQWRLLSERLQIKSTPPRVIQATGNVRYADPTIHLRGRDATYTVDDKLLLMEAVDYQCVGRQGRGHAARLQQSDRYRVIQQGSFTTCLPGDNSWQIKGSKLVIDSQQQIAKLWHARFLIAGYPILYSPFWQLPIGDQSRSGFLSPTVVLPTSWRASRFGEHLELSLPYYWRLAPNLDATLTPHYIGRRGLQWQLNGRYLLAPGSGVVAYDYLHRDRQQPALGSRHLFHWQHQGVFKRHWRFAAAHTKVSDKHYFSDLKSHYGSVTDHYATQEYHVGYSCSQWESHLLTRDFQLFQTENRTTYRLQPQWSFTFLAPQALAGGSDFQLYTQLAQLNSSHHAQPSATRWHLAPMLKQAWRHRLGTSGLETQLLATYYQQRRSGLPGAPEHEQIKRVVPQFKFDHRWLWSRPWCGAKASYQTIEPRLLYLYRPYRDQSRIANYDSTWMQKGYSSLFSDQHWSGLDRISSVNHLVMGVSSRWFDSQCGERGMLSLGQVLPFSKVRTGIKAEDDLPGRGANQWVASASGLLSDQWSLHSGVQFRSPKQPLLTEALLEYRLDAHRMVQLNGQFATLEALQEYVVNHPIQTQGIAQLGLTTSWLFNQRWVLVASYHYDLKARQTVKRQLGLQYNTCCWSIGVNYQRALTAYSSQGRYEDKLFLQLQLQGLGARARDLGCNRLLTSTILPYQRPLFLPK